MKLFTGKRPYSEISNHAAMLYKILNSVLPERPDAGFLGLDDRLWELMQRCWMMEPGERPKIDDILQIVERVSGDFVCS